jgi:hypothetical protein
LIGFSSSTDTRKRQRGPENFLRGDDPGPVRRLAARLRWTDDVDGSLLATRAVQSEVPMDRREFLRGFGKTLIVLPWGTFLVQCGSSHPSSGNAVVANPTVPDPTPPDAPPQVLGPDVIYTSTSVDLHSHTFTVPAAQFSVPTGVSGTTSEAQAHTHDVDFTFNDFSVASSGETVKITTTSTLGHMHVFTLVRVNQG